MSNRFSDFLDHFDSEKVSPFLLAYIVQTRKEIDTEKHERDQILNYIIVAASGIGFVAIFKAGNLSILPHYRLDLVFVAAAATIFLCSLFNTRRQKLQQIADRWYVLKYLLAAFLGDDQRFVGRFLEGHVTDQFELTQVGLSRYAGKDLWLNSSIVLILWVPVIGITYANEKLAFLSFGALSVTLVWIIWFHSRKLSNNIDQHWR